jgi:hypothetical protein
LKDSLKHKIGTALPYVAIFGMSAVAAYAVSKIYKTVKDIDFPLDFGNDTNLSNFHKKD